MGRLLGHSDVDMVREATDLVRLIGEHISLRPRGREHVCICPFHDDHSPSMAVVTHKGNAFYKCHACGAGGDAFDFVMNYHKMEFPEALRYLADRAGIKLKPRREESSSESGASRADLRKVNAFAATFFQRTLTDVEAGATAREVIQQRGISDDMVRAFGLGAATNQWDSLTNLVQRRGLPQEAFIKAGLIKPRPNESGCYDAFRNRVIFPICDELGNPIAFGARKINPDDEPKYLNSAESGVFSKSQTLYGLHLAKRSIIESRQVIVTEGYTDVIACHQAGITNVVGTLGTALTAEHARILSRLCDTVVLIFDGDEAGQRAADRAVSVFFSQPVDIRICVLPDDLDPDELLKLDGGRDRFNAAAAKSVDALEYRIRRFRAQLDGASGLSARQKRLEAFLAELGELGFAHVQGVRKSMVLSQLSDLLNIPMAELERSLPRPRSAAPGSASPSATSMMEAAPDADESHIPRARRIAERDLLAILVYEPQAGREFMTVESGASGPITALCSVEDFAVDSCRAVALPVLEAIAGNRTITVQQLLGALDDEHHRRLASSLYFHGQTLCGTAPDAAQPALVTAVEALHACLKRDEFNQSAARIRHGASEPDSVAAFEDFLRQRRQAGHAPAALAQGVRS